MENNLGENGKNVQRTLTAPFTPSAIRLAKDAAACMVLSAWWDQKAFKMLPFPPEFTAISLSDNHSLGWESPAFMNPW